MALRSGESPCTCSKWPRIANDPFFPIWLNPKTSEYILLFGERAEGALVIYYCPTCGGRMPRSRRGELFVVPSDEEVKEVRDLLEKISDVNTMRSVLGEPDDVFEWFRDETGKLIQNTDAPGFARQYKYLYRWKTLQLSIQESENGHLQFFFFGQPKAEDKKV